MVKITKELETITHSISTSMIADGNSIVQDHEEQGDPGSDFEDVDSEYLYQGMAERWAVALEYDPQAFWVEVYREIFNRKIWVLPVMHKCSIETRAATRKYRMMLVFIPAVSESDYPASFVRPNWFKHINISNPKVNKAEQRTLPGRWVLVDTTPKPDRSDKNSYQDRLTKDLGLTTRFNTSWNDCENVLLPKFAKLMGMSREAVRLMTVEEWNFVANLFNWLREHRGMNLPDLGPTHSAELCDNRYGSVHRLDVGGVGYGGLAAVGRIPPARSNGYCAFRFLAVL